MNDIDTLLSQARTLAKSDHADASAAIFNLLLQMQPTLIEAHVYLAGHALRHGDPGAAVAHCEQAVNANQDDVELHKSLAVALCELMKSERAEIDLDAIVSIQPHAYCSDLYRAHLQERRGNQRSALISYLRAIRTAQLRGFWLDQDTTQPWLLDLVVHAMEVAHAGRLQLFHEWLVPMQELYGRDEMKRVAECLAMYLGQIPTIYADPRQKPGFLYFPGLPVAPVFDRKNLVFAEWYEAQANAIREEMLAIVSESTQIQPFHYQLTEAQRSSLTQGGSWDAYFFYRDGERFSAHHDACPATSAVLAKLPLDHVRKHGPEVCFSLMRPSAHILPHRGVTNTRAVLHLGLAIPEHCALNLVEVGAVKWREGGCFAFDDTYEHEAWNHSDTTRVILLGDIWNPYLTEAECAATAGLIGLIGDFNASTAGAPLS